MHCRSIFNCPLMEILSFFWFWETLLLETKTTSFLPDNLLCPELQHTAWVFGRPSPQPPFFLCMLCHLPPEAVLLAILPLRILHRSYVPSLEWHYKKKWWCFEMSWETTYPVFTYWNFCLRNRRLHSDRHQRDVYKQFALQKCGSYKAVALKNIPHTFSWMSGTTRYSTIDYKSPWNM